MVIQRSLYASEIPADKTNIWGIPEVVLDGRRYLVLDGFNDTQRHRLSSATWRNALWLDEEWRHSFLGLVFDHVCNRGSMVSGGRAKARQELSGVSPEGLAQCVAQIRVEHDVPRNEGMESIIWEDGAVCFWTSSRRRKLVWKPLPGKDDEDVAGACHGTLEVDFGGSGSHEFLRQLISRFGVPEEALQELQQ